MVPQWRALLNFPPINNENAYSNVITHHMMRLVDGV